MKLLKSRNFNITCTNTTGIHVPPPLGELSPGPDLDLDPNQGPGPGLGLDQSLDPDPCPGKGPDHGPEVVAGLLSLQLSYH